MKLPKRILEAFESANIELFNANRQITNFWNQRRLKNEPMLYTGWYWYQKNRREIFGESENGPFKTKMAAIRDCYLRLKLQRKNR